MALISCPECGNKVSDSAVQCPNCGFGVERFVSRQRKIAEIQAEAEAEALHFVRNKMLEEKEKAEQEKQKIIDDNNKKYSLAVQLSKSETSNDVKRAADLFRSLEDGKNYKEIIEDCEDRYAKLKEVERIEEEKTNKQKRIIKKISIAVIAIIVVFLLVYLPLDKYYIQPKAMAQEAVEMYSYLNGEWECSFYKFYDDETYAYTYTCNGAKNTVDIIDKKPVLTVEFVVDKLQKEKGTGEGLENTTDSKKAVIQYNLNDLSLLSYDAVFGASAQLALQDDDENRFSITILGDDLKEHADNDKLFFYRNMLALESKEQALKSMSPGLFEDLKYLNLTLKESGISKWNSTTWSDISVRSSLGKERFLGRDAYVYICFPSNKENSKCRIECTIYENLTEQFKKELEEKYNTAAYSIEQYSDNELKAFIVDISDCYSIRVYGSYAETSVSIMLKSSAEEINSAKAEQTSQNESQEDRYNNLTNSEKKEICNYIDSRYDYYDSLYGGYSGDRYSDTIMQEAAKKYNLTVEQVNIIWMKKYSY